ncbi:DUF2267 domain-containing protein [Rhodohalobacter sp.]|uniref:DUF2267 domain-containing protein n=1 Tax=Rhodohalobacter sp. TaxID=1974210 RepID=UPI002ACDDD91|nr:DUF2267 domain-containing protein [Rhodohalobacter sp.]MDZ7757972.1 DUF2267 domain-containing protein [Rhodohalobacter sp.]
MSIQVNFDKHSKEANEWLLEIGDRAGFPDRTDWSYGCLRAVLHTLRDRTTIEEVFQLSAQLPVLIRGIFFEGYKPSGKPDKLNAEEFMSRIKKDLGNANPISADEAFRVVIELLYDRTTPGEMDDIRGQMPKAIQQIWNKYRPLETENDWVE